MFSEIIESFDSIRNIANLMIELLPELDQQLICNITRSTFRVWFCRRI